MGQHPSRAIVEIQEENSVSPLWSCKNFDYDGSLSVRPKQRGFVPPCTDVQGNSRNLSSTAWKAGNCFDSLMALLPKLPWQLRNSGPVSLPLPVRRRYRNRAPSLGLVLLWGILSLEKNHKVLTPRRAVCFSPRSHGRYTALSHCGSSTFPNEPTHRRDTDMEYDLSQKQDVLYNKWLTQAAQGSGLLWSHNERLKNFIKLQTSIAFPEKLGSNPGD